MKHIYNISQQAMSGDAQALKKLLVHYENDIRYICTVLTDNQQEAEQFYLKTTNLLSVRITSLSSDTDFNIYIRKLSAEVCSDKLSADHISEISEQTDDSNDLITISESGKKNYTYLSDIQQRIYYCTEKEDYRIFILFFYVGLTIDEIAALYDADKDLIQNRLNTAVYKIKRSIPSIENDSTIRIDLKALTELLVNNKAPAGQRVSSSQHFSFFKTNKGKIIIVSIFAVLLMCVSFEIFYNTFLNAQNVSPAYDNPYPSDNQTTINYYQYDPDRPTVSDMMQDASDDILYTVLVSDTTSSFEECGLKREGFVKNKGEITLLEVIVTNMDAEPVTTDDIEVSFSDGSPNNENGKRYFVYSIFPVNDKTSLIKIFAPGTYMPEQFEIDLYRNRELFTSYILPSELIPISDISDIIVHSDISETNLIEANSNDIVSLYTRQNIQSYYYVVSSKMKHHEISDNTYSATVQLYLIQVGFETADKLSKDDFQFHLNTEAQKKYQDQIKNISCEIDSDDNAEYPDYGLSVTYMVDISFKEKALSNDLYEIGNYITNGYFLYNGQGQDAKINLISY